MPRKGRVKTREVEKDPVYQSRLVTKLINRAMKDGKKSTARKQIYNAFKIIKEKEKTDPMTVFRQALNNIKPDKEVRSRRVGGAAYQVPMPVRGKRKDSLALRWLVTSARGRPNSDYHTYAEKLAAEIIDAYNQQGGAYSKKEQVERAAEANKAFSHLRW
jgi:small subunit ribosomal protein S7